MNRWIARKGNLGRTALVVGVTAGALVLAGCGGAKVGASNNATTTAGTSAGGSGGGTTSATGAASATPKKCGSVKLADNAWVGYEADLAVVSYLMKTKLGCTVSVKHINEQVSWQGFPTGQVDAVLENWGHDDLVANYITKQKTAQDAGPAGVKGIIGWYVPPWMAQKYPDITSWKNLNKYASLFKTSESGGKGQLLDGDPSYVTNDQALVKNLKLNYKVVEGGSEAALITSFRQAQAKKTPLLAYFYQPQWFFNEVDLVKVNLPKWTKGCDAVAAKVACDYPPYLLNKIVSTKFATSGSPAYTVIKNFTWTNEQQNIVSKYIAVNKMSDDAAAKKFFAQYPALATQWLAGTGAK
jgi:glycine betaine/proline transport system substrate-binding protein